MIKLVMTCPCLLTLSLYTCFTWTPPASLYLFTTNNSLRGLNAWNETLRVFATSRHVFMQIHKYGNLISPFNFSMICTVLWLVTARLSVLNYSVTADLFYYKGRLPFCSGLLSKYPEVPHLFSKNSEAVIMTMKDIFARHGIPERLITDNMPFKSVKFKDFAGK